MDIPPYKPSDYITQYTDFDKCLKRNESDQEILKRKYNIIIYTGSSNMNFGDKCNIFSDDLIIKSFQFCFADSKIVANKPRATPLR